MTSDVAVLRFRGAEYKCPTIGTGYVQATLSDLIALRSGQGLADGGGLEERLEGSVSVILSPAPVNAAVIGEGSNPLSTL